MVTPAERLEGLVLDNGWVVGERRNPNATDTGGYCSVCYFCESKNGKPAFLKAFDFSKAFSRGDAAQTIQEIATEFNFEKNILDICKSLSRVITVLDAGEKNLNESTTTPSSHDLVLYIVFEYAEATIRSEISAEYPLTASWRLRVFHHVAVGLRQLHSKRIAHQDLKPSNILLFKENGAKLGDLGRSISQHMPVPHDNLVWPGDFHYAPPEIAYGYQDTEFNVRRLATDLYLLGSFGVSLFTQISMTVWLKEEIDINFRSPFWGGNFSGNYEDVLVHVENAFVTAIEKISQKIEESPYKEDLIQCIRELCQPNPKLRGHPIIRANLGKTANPYNIERYLTRFDILTKKAGIHENKGRLNGRQ